MQIVNSQIKEILHASRPFQYLGPNELDLILAHCTLISFNESEIILQQGKKSRGMYIIIKGKATISVKILGERTIDLAILSEYDFIGETSLIENELCSATVIAQTAMQCLLLENKYFITLSVIHPEISFKINKAISENICKRLQDKYKEIRNIIDHSNIATWFLLEEMMLPLSKLKPVTIMEKDVDKDEFYKLPIFEFFSQDEYNIWLDYTNIIKVGKNYPLISENDENPDYYIVAGGAVELSIVCKKKHAKLAVLGPGELVGDTYYISGSLSHIRYVTRERCILFKITIENLQRLQQEQILIWYKFFNLICRSLIASEKALDKLYIRLNTEIYNR